MTRRCGTFGPPLKQGIWSRILGSDGPATGDDREFTMLHSEVRSASEPAVGSITAMLQWGAAVALLAGAVVHAIVMPQHLREWWLAGVFFAVLTYAGVASAVYVASGSRRAPLLAIALNALTVVIWAVSRTSGLPFGPGAGVPEPAGRADITATSFQLAALVMLAPLLRLRTAPLVLGTARRAVRTACLAFAVLVVGTAGLVARPGSSGVQSHHDRARGDLVVPMSPGGGGDPDDHHTPAEQRDNAQPARSSGRRPSG